MAQSPITPTPNFNPALDLPFLDVPMTLIGIREGAVYFYEFETEPTPTEYTKAGAVLVQRMLGDLGEGPAEWLYVLSKEVDWEEFGHRSPRDPVRVN